MNKFLGESQQIAKNKTPSSRLASVIIPARNEESSVGKVVRTVLEQRLPDMDLEVIVVDDGSEDYTQQEAISAGATVICLGNETNGGNPAIARNRGAAASHGDPIIFLDSDCLPGKGWLQELIHSHYLGVAAVGGSMGLPSGLSTIARSDYYSGWYHVHPKRREGLVAHHPPGNLSIQRDSFEYTRGFCERPPVAYSHEELAWQADLRRAGGAIYFNPRAVVYHYNRPGFANLLRRHYRWGYGAIASKVDINIARFSFIYKYPYFLIVASLPLGFLCTFYVILCWLRSGKMEVILLAPLIFFARLAYSIGMMMGGFRCLNRRGQSYASRRPRWQ